MAERQRAGDARTEDQRRRRVVHGWAFKDLPPEEVQEIKDYLDGGPIPANYIHIDKALR